MTLSSLQKILAPSIIALAVTLIGSQSHAQTINVVLTDNANNPVLGFVNLQPGQALGVDIWQGTVVDFNGNSSAVALVQTGDPNQFLYFVGDGMGLPYPFGSIGVIDLTPNPDVWQDTTGANGLAYIIII